MAPITDEEWKFGYELATQFRLVLSENGYFHQKADLEHPANLIAFGVAIVRTLKKMEVGNGARS